MRVISSSLTSQWDIQSVNSLVNESSRNVCTLPLYSPGEVGRAAEVRIYWLNTAIHLRRRRKINRVCSCLIARKQVHCRRRRQKIFRIWGKPCARILSLLGLNTPPLGGWGGVRESPDLRSYSPKCLDLRPMVYHSISENSYCTCKCTTPVSHNQNLFSD